MANLNLYQNVSLLTGYIKITDIEDKFCSLVYIDAVDVNNRTVFISDIAVSKYPIGSGKLPAMGNKNAADSEKEDLRVQAILSFPVLLDKEMLNKLLTKLLANELNISALESEVPEGVMHAWEQN